MKKQTEATKQKRNRQVATAFRKRIRRQKKKAAAIKPPE